MTRFSYKDNPSTVFLRACFNDYYKNQASDPIFEIMTRGCFFRMFDLFTIDLDSKTIYEC